MALKNSYGFSLIEVLVALAITATVAVGFATYVENHARIISRLESKQNLLNLSEEIKLATQDQLECTSLLSTPPQSISLSNLRTTDPLQGATLSLTLSNGTRLADGSAINSYGLYIKRLYLKSATPANAQNSFLGSLKLEVAPLASPERTMKTVSIPLRITTDAAGQIVTCGAASTAGPSGSFCGLFNHDSNSGFTGGFPCGDLPVGQCPAGYVLSSLSSSGGENIDCGEMNWGCGQTPIVSTQACVSCGSSCGAGRAVTSN